MRTALKISVGQHSDRGVKEVNQDFHAVCIPEEPKLSSKGVVIVLTDGIGSSQASQVAGEAAVRGMVEDYYCTSDDWSVRQSVQRVLTATNAWLHAQAQRNRTRFDRDRGYVCALSAMVIDSTTAHLFHAGDTRIYRVQALSLEQLTQDHRVWISPEQSYLSRALGFHPQLQVDYQALPVEPGETFLLASDGVYEYADDQIIARTVQRHGSDLDAAARAVVDEALQRGSRDSLTMQIVRVDALPADCASATAGDNRRETSAAGVVPTVP
jgi:serine/threonine protein phosphatase PrpC